MNIGNKTSRIEEYLLIPIMSLNVYRQVFIMSNFYIELVIFTFLYGILNSFSVI